MLDVVLNFPKEELIDGVDPKEKAKAAAPKKEATPKKATAPAPAADKAKAAESTELTVNHELPDGSTVAGDASDARTKQLRLTWTSDLNYNTRR